MDNSSSPADQADAKAHNQQRSKLYQWVDERLGLGDMLAFAKKKTVPQHKHSFWYYMGGISLFLFMVQGITGVLLLVYYRPGPDAYESVRQITYVVDFGWLIRSAHSWSAMIMMAGVVVHMFSVFFMKAYRKPREFGWWTGLLLLGLTMAWGFTGYLLPMDELAYFATKVGLESAKAIPGGEFLANLLRGGPDVGQHTVQRFFVLHVVILPALFFPVLMFHLWLVQKHGNAIPPCEEQVPVEERRTIPFFPNFFMKDIAMWLLAMNVLTALAVFYPWELGPAAPEGGLGAAPEGIHPEWYFMSAFQLLKVLGNWFPGVTGELIGMVLFTAGIVLWALVPLYDKDSKNGRRAKIATWFGIFFLGINIVLTIWGYAAVGKFG